MKPSPEGAKFDSLVQRARKMSYTKQALKGRDNSVQL
jgi:hypothetical protein